MSRKAGGRRRRKSLSKKWKTGYTSFGLSTDATDSKDPSLGSTRMGALVKCFSNTDLLESVLCVRVGVLVSRKQSDALGL
jgi:hypothetical protein